jgi:hypothetical protein
MKDLAKIQEFFSKPLNEESTTFKVGDKVTYLGHPAEITAVNKEMTGEITYNVAYNKGQGRTKASNINLKSGAIKPLNEESTTFKVGDIVSKKYASTDEDYTKKFKIIDITGMRATLQDIKTGKQTGIALSDLTERIINRLKNK